MSISSKNESFASRWSRRKQEVALEERIEVAIDDEINNQTKSQPRSISKEEERLEKLNALTDEDMPDLETLGEDSDYAGFMSANVSEGLRKLALQKLFQGKTYNVRDGLDEYDGDYTTFEKLDPSIITADMKHLLEVEAKKLLAKETAEEEQLERQVVDAAEPLEGEESINELEQIAQEPDMHKEVIDSLSSDLKDDFADNKLEESLVKATTYEQQSTENKKGYI